MTSNKATYFENAVNKGDVACYGTVITILAGIVVPTTGWDVNRIIDRETSALIKIGNLGVTNSLLSTMYFLAIGRTVNQRTASIHMGGNKIAGV